MADQQTLQIRILHIKTDEDRTYDIFRLQQDQVLRFLLDSSLLCMNRRVRLFTNYPLPHVREVRSKRHHMYAEVHWQCCSQTCSIFTDVVAEIIADIPGTYHFYYVIGRTPDRKKATGHGHFIVDPKMEIDGRRVPLDSLCMQTVITKLLGGFDDWEARLKVAIETGYNVLHFTPVQELGASNNAYCIKDHHRLSSAYSLDKRRTFLMFPHMKDLVDCLFHEHGVLSVTDLVLTHVARDAPLLECHPQVAHSLKNTPSLRPAYLLDRILHHFTLEVARDQWRDHGVPAQLSDRIHLDAMRHVLYCEVFPKYKLPEFYQADVKKATAAVLNYVMNGSLTKGHKPGPLVLTQDDQYHRNACQANPEDFGHAYFAGIRENQHDDCPEVGVPEAYHGGVQSVEAKLHQLNHQKEEETWGHINAAIDNFIRNAEYRFLAEDGPRLDRVSRDNLIQPPYFVCPRTHDESVEKAERMMDKEPQLVMACNGWLYNQPRRNYTEDITSPSSMVYFRRELVPWQDSVKLCYPKNLNESPELMNHMQMYVENTAKVFHGIRIYAAHTIPLNISEFLVDCARKVRPKLIVIAELATGDSKYDNYFVNRLGVHAVIREMKHADKSDCLMGMVASFGGAQLGSFVQPRIQHITPCGPPAIFYDQTHDSDSPMKLRSEYCLWPMSAVLAMTKCAVGSTRGYDELVPHPVDIVEETRVYQRWSEGGKDGVDFTMGMVRGRRLLNHLHRRMADEGFTDIHMEDLGDNVLEIVRYNPTTHKTVVMVAAMMYTLPGDPNRLLQARPLTVQGEVSEVLFEGCLVHDPDGHYMPSEDEINGLPSSHFYLELRENLPLEHSYFCHVTGTDDHSTITLANFTPGSVLVLQCKLTDKAENAVAAIEKSLREYNGMMRNYTGDAKYDKAWSDSSFKPLANNLSLGDLNRVMYRVGVEEDKDKYSISTYNLPNYGSFSYCGLRGVMSVLSEVRTSNNMGHALCHNLRDGPWFMDYTVHRLHVTRSTRPLAIWLEKLFEQVKNIPAFLKPSLIDAIISGTYVVLREIALQQLTEFVKDGSTFVQALALSSIQFMGYVRNARLPPLSPRLMPSPRTEVFYGTINKDKVITEVQAPVSLASGLPHFAEGKWRCWGRDTFISLRGMLLLTGRYIDARNLILAYGGALRHGLIPNLLWEGQNARYNSRDAVWWWLHAIHDYTTQATEGESILQDPVLRLYPTDDTPSNRTGHCEQKLHEVMQEAVSRHMAGINFKEREAGLDLDAYMTDQGFNVEVGVRWPQGYVYGGNIHNCGTWMDFMGRSHDAGNWGKPATPRDGSAVEIVGLSYSVLTWLAELSQRDVYPHKGVERTTPDFKDELVTFEQWASHIKQHFESDFYVPFEPLMEGSSPNSKSSPSLKESQSSVLGQVVRRGIYKDCLHSSQAWAQSQLRPNFCIAMVLAPDLFDVDHAWGALEQAERVLMGPVGMKTLDPEDPHYNGHYSVCGDYTNPKVAAGYNYHNGPEFLWPMAYFLRAKLLFAHRLHQREEEEDGSAVNGVSEMGKQNKTVTLVKQVLYRQSALLTESPWKSLPQLTNRDGAFCKDGCCAQATSNACTLELVYDLERMGRHVTPNPEYTNEVIPVTPEPVPF